MKRLLYILTAIIALLTGCSDSGVEGIEGNFDKTLLDGKDISGVWVAIYDDWEVGCDWIDLDYVVWRLAIFDGETMKSLETSGKNYGFKDGYLYDCSLGDFDDHTELSTINFIGEKVYIDGKYAGIMELQDNNTIRFAEYYNDYDYVDTVTLKKLKGFKKYGEFPSSEKKDSTGLPISLDNEIYYRTVDNKPLSVGGAVGEDELAHSYDAEKGYGRIVCINPIYYLGNLDFYDCASLTNINLPSCVTTIDWSAFYDCSSLVSITIPDSVTSIGESAFSNCWSLASVYCEPTSPPSGASDMFDNNASGRKIYVPAESVDAYKSASYWRDYSSAIVGYDFENNSLPNIDEPQQPDISLGKVLYYDNFDKVVANKNGSYWPYMSAEYGNPTPSNQAGVSYDSYYITVRTTGSSNHTSSSNYADEASGNNNLFFGKTKNYMKICNISLEELTGNSLTLTFGTEKYSDSGNSVFDMYEFCVYVSGDGYKWTPLSYSFPEGANTTGRWNVATAEFSLTEVPSNLYLYFTANVASVYRIDDVTLMSGGNGEKINLSNGYSL